MGSCCYYMRAVFAQPLTTKKVRDIQDFFLQASKAEDDDDFSTKCSWKDITKKYPALKHPIIKKEWRSLRIYGSDDVLYNLDAKEGQTIVRYRNEVSHLASWQPLCHIMTDVFGATDAKWISDEIDNASPDYILEYEDDKDIVEAILDKPSADLPTFLGIHPVLDARIAAILSGKG